MILTGDRAHEIWSSFRQKFSEAISDAEDNLAAMQDLAEITQDREAAAEVEQIYRAVIQSAAKVVKVQFTPGGRAA